MCPSEAPPRAIRLLIADDHPVVRASLLSFLGSAPDVTIVGMAKDGLEAVRLARSAEPDVIIMDVQMPNRDGVEATTQILGTLPQCKIVGFSLNVDEASVRRMLEAGAIGFLSKRAAKAELLFAVREVSAGRPYFSRDIAGRAFWQTILDKDTQRDPLPPLGPPVNPDAADHNDRDRPPAEL